MFFNQTIYVTRTKGEYGSGGYVDGIWVENEATVFPIRTSVQPASESDTAFLPEGREAHEAYVLYSKTKLVQAEGSTNADKVRIHGQDYTVVRTEYWENNLIPHCRSLVVKEVR